MYERRDKKLKYCKLHSSPEDDEGINLQKWKRSSMIDRGWNCEGGSNYHTDHITKTIITEKLSLMNDRCGLSILLINNVQERIKFNVAENWIGWRWPRIDHPASNLIIMLTSLSRINAFINYKFVYYATKLICIRNIIIFCE